MGYRGEPYAQETIKILLFEDDCSFSLIAETLSLDATVDKTANSRAEVTIYS
jgi:hypothetical protein